MELLIVFGYTLTSILLAPLIARAIVGGGDKHEHNRTNHCLPDMPGALQGLRVLCSRPKRMPKMREQSRITHPKESRANYGLSEYSARDAAGVFWKVTTHAGRDQQ